MPQRNSHTLARLTVLRPVYKLRAHFQGLGLESIVGSKC